MAQTEALAPVPARAAAPAPVPVASAAASRLSGAQIVLRALEEQGVEVIFGYPGGAVLPLYDALAQQDRLRHVLVRHEQGAAHAAEGYARATGQVGVVLVTSGPGATNIVTGLADAMLDSIPLVAITGQVPTHLIGNDAFQECDTTGITRACTKHNILVKDVADLARAVHEAFHVARSGRPGPVVIDLPKDVQVALGTYQTAETALARHAYRPRRTPEAAKIEAVVDLLAGAERPILYTGGGIVNAGPAATVALRRFVALTGIPVTSTLLGLGAIPSADPAFLGMLGMHGTYEANLAMHGCDAMLAVGARFDDRVTGKVSAFSPGSRKAHIDIDPSSINKNVRVEIGLVADAGLALEALIAAWERRGLGSRRPAIQAWWAQIEAWRQVDCLRFGSAPGIIKPQEALVRLRTALAAEQARGREVFVTTEVGQHQMWAAQHLAFDAPGRFVTSGGLGTMGFGLPAAIGIQVARPQAQVIDVAGEASILMNIQELSTALQYRLPVKVFILNNQWMGMVRQWQDLLHGGRHSESYSAALPDFVRLAEAFGGVGLRIEHPDQLDAGIQAMLAVEGRPCLVDVAVDPTENCYPMIPGGAAHNEILLGPEHQVTLDPAAREDGMVLV